MTHDIGIYALFDGQWAYLTLSAAILRPPPSLDSGVWSQKKKKTYTSQMGLIIFVLSKVHVVFSFLLPDKCPVKLILVKVKQLLTTVTQRLGRNLWRNQVKSTSNSIQFYIS